MNLSLSSSSFDKIINPYSEFLGLYGGGADDLVERRGGGGIPSVNLMEELLGCLSSHQGATCRSSMRGCLPPYSAETRRPSASAKNLPMRRMLMNASFSSR